MADSRDNQTGRMLFTDFDVSDKGRPASPLQDVDLRAFMPSRLPTIADIASNLELDFEDDGDGQPEPSLTSAFGNENSGERLFPEPGGEDIPQPTAAPDDAELSLDDSRDDIPNDAPPERPITWEDYTRAYRSAPPPETTVPDVSPPNPESPARGPITRPAGAPLPIEEDGEIGDILSYLSSLTIEDMSKTGSYPGGRLGVPPPPASPYGGVERVDNWYVPPEAAADSPSIQNRDWYEPPETPVADGIPAPDGEDAYSKPTRRVIKADPTDTPGAGTRFVDMFSDIDLDEVWNQRIDRARSPADREQPPSGDTGLVDMFNELDLDSLWQSRVQDAETKSRDEQPVANDRPAAPPPETPAPKAPPPLSPDTTQVLSTGALFGDGTATPHHHDEAAAEAAAEDEAGDLLASLDRFMDEDPGKRPADAPAPTREETVAAPTEVKAVRRARGFNLDELAFEDDFGEATNASVQAPVIDDSLLIEPTVRDREAPAKTSGATADARQPAHDGTTSRTPRPKAGPAAGGDKAELDTAPYEGEIYQLEDIATEEERSGTAAPNGAAPARRKAKRKGLSTDDLLNDLDLDGDAVDHSVSAPVIDDSAIDVPVGPRPGTEEMLAIAEQENAEEPEADAVAVNPMDVFANMDDMDFSGDGLDDEMRAMLDEDAEGEGEPEKEDNEPAADDEDGAAVWTGVPRGPVKRVALQAASLVRKVVPMSLVERLQKIIAWRENWWFYCDLLALLISTASMAVIISYYVWYRE